MRLDGAPYAPRDPLDARRAGVAMIYQELSLAPHLSVMENIVLGVEPVRGGVAGPRHGPARSDARDGDRRARRARPPRHRPRTRRSAICRRPRSSSSRSRARSPSAAACSSSTSRRAASDTRDVQSLFELIGRLKAQGHRDRLHLALHRGSEGGLGSVRRAARRPERRRRRDRRDAAPRRSSA